MTSHDQVRNSMLWRVKIKDTSTGKELSTLARLCDISDEKHLDNIKKMMLKENQPNKLYNGYRADTWIQAINSEIRYRTKLGHVIFENLSKNSTIVHKIRPERLVCA